MIVDLRARRIAMRIALSIAAALAAVMSTSAAFADEMRVGGVAISGVTITGLSEGRVRFRSANREDSRPIGETQLRIDSIPSLRSAEDHLDEGRLDEAVAHFHLAIGEAKEPWQRAWVNYRLAVVLDGHGRFTEAAGAWAQILRDSRDSYWSVAAPAGKADRPTRDTAESSLTALHEARAIRGLNPMLRNVVDDLLAAVQSIRDETLKPGYEPGTRADEPPPTVTAPPKNATKPPPADSPATGPTTASNAKPTTPTDVGDVPGNEIDAMISSGRMSDARSALERLAAKPGRYPLDQLLYQYGRVLRAAGEKRPAAVRFMQSAVLFPDGRWAAPALLQTARLYRDDFANLESARRLFQRAAELAKAAGDDAAAQAASAEGAALLGDSGTDNGGAKP